MDYKNGAAGINIRRGRRGAGVSEGGINVERQDKTLKEEEIEKGEGKKGDFGHMPGFINPQKEI